MYNIGVNLSWLLLLNYIAFAYDLSQQCQWCLHIVWLNIQQPTHRHCVASSVLRLCQCEHHKASSTVSPSVVYTSMVASCQATTVPSTHCLIMLNLFVPCVCTFIYMYTYCLQWQSSQQTKNGSLFHEAWQLLATHVAIYWNKFRVYMALGDQGVTNTTDTDIEIFYMQGLLSRWMCGSLRLIPKVGWANTHMRQFG